MLAAGAAERHQREVAGVDALLDGHLPDGCCHAGVDDAVDSLCGLLQSDPEMVGDLHDSRFRQLAPQAREPVRLDEPKHQVGVGHRAGDATPAVAGGAGVGTRTLRTDA
jgi:hypothetical protein